MRSVAEVDQRGEQAVTKPPQPCDIAAAAARGEPGSLREVRAGRQRVHELRDLARIRGAVRVDHCYDIAGRGLEPAGKRVPFSSAILLHNPDIGAQPTGHRHCVVYRVPVHHDHLMEVFGHPREYVRQISRFIPRWKDHGYPWPRQV